jgi:hypothetical protein
MLDFFNSVKPDVFIPIITLSLVALCLLALIVAVSLYKAHKNSIAAALKQDILNRGMSAEEIQSVLEAGQKQ